MRRNRRATWRAADTASHTYRTMFKPLPMRFETSLDHAQVIERLDYLASKSSLRWKPCPKIQGSVSESGVVLYRERGGFPHARCYGEFRGRIFQERGQTVLVGEFVTYPFSFLAFFIVVWLVGSVLFLVTAISSRSLAPIVPALALLALALGARWINGLNLKAEAKLLEQAIRETLVSGRMTAG